MNTEKNSKDYTNKKYTVARCLPSIITLCSFCFGLTSIVFALRHHWKISILFVFISTILDAFDGRVARLLGQTSQFGAQLDSLSDLVCFGVAPTLILFLYSLHLLGDIGWGICMFFTSCQAIRLARFNVSLNTCDNAPYFIGVPAPASALIALFPIILSFAFNRLYLFSPNIFALFMLLAGILSISTIKTFSSKNISLRYHNAALPMVAIALAIICLLSSFWISLCSLLTMYLISIPYASYRLNKNNNPSMPKLAYIENSK